MRSCNLYIHLFSYPRMIKSNIAIRLKIINGTGIKVNTRQRKGERGEGRGGEGERGRGGEAEKGGCTYFAVAAEQHAVR